MSVAIWVSCALVVLQSPDAAGPDAGTKASCVLKERNDLQPGRGPFDPARRAKSPYSAAVWADLAEPAGNTPVLMLVMTNYSGAPEQAVFVTRKPGSPTATVSLRVYLDNMWFEMMLWEERQRKQGLRPSGPEAEQAFLKTASRKVDRFQASIDDGAAALIERVWSRMIARARPDGPSRVIIRDGDQIHFQSREGWASGWARDEGTVGGQLVALGKMLTAYARAAPRERRPLRDRLVAAATSLEADIDRLNRCEREEVRPPAAPSP
jgi:hypothetical protein